MSTPRKKTPGKRGPKPRYKATFHPPLAEAWAAAGKTDKEIAEILGIVESTFTEWKKKYPELLESLKRGKEIPDDQVKDSLFNRANGFTITGEREVIGLDGKKTGVEKKTKYYPPDSAACIFWLCNRRPDKWRHVSRIEHTGKDGKSLEDTFVKALESINKMEGS